MPILRPSPSDYTTVVKALANAGAAVSNPQGSRPPSKGGGAFVNVASVAALIRGSPRLVTMPAPKVEIVPRFIPAAAAAETIVPLTNAGGTDGFVVKYNSTGQPLWARRIGGAGNDGLTSTSIDSSGNIVVLGTHSSVPLNIYRGDGTIAFTSTATGFEGFVVKYNSEGTPQWIRRFGGAVNDDTYSMTTDSSGNIFVVGVYSSNPFTVYNADGTTASSITLARTNIAFDGFILKYSSDGTPQWARRLGGTGNDFATTVVSDSNGNIVVSTFYDSNPQTIYRGDGTTAFTLTGTGYDVSVIKYDSTGDPLWARRIGGTRNRDTATSVTTDSSGNVIVTGYYDSNPLNIYDADGTTPLTTLTNPNEGTLELFLVKYASNGNLVWVKRLSGNGDEIGNGVATDSIGNVFVAGSYGSSPLTILYGNGNTAFELANGGVSDGVLVKYDSNGEPVWGRRIGGTGSDSITSVITDSNGNIIVAGDYTSNPVTVYNADGTTAFTLTNSGSTDVFLVKYNSEGTPQWARKVGGTGNDAIGSLKYSYVGSVGTIYWGGGAIRTDSSGNIVVTGQYASNPLTIT